MRRVIAGAQAGRWKGGLAALVAGVAVLAGLAGCADGDPVANPLAPASSGAPQAGAPQPEVTSDDPQPSEAEPEPTQRGEAESEPAGPQGDGESSDDYVPVSGYLELPILIAGQRVDLLLPDERGWEARWGVSKGGATWAVRAATPVNGFQANVIISEVDAAAIGGMTPTEALDARMQTGAEKLSNFRSDGPAEAIEMTGLAGARASASYTFDRYELDLEEWLVQGAQGYVLISLTAQAGDEASLDAVRHIVESIDVF